MERVGWDGTAVVWDAASGARRMTLTGDGTAVAVARWNPDESRIRVVTMGGSTRVYVTNMPGLLARACQYATRNLTWVEWQLYLSGEPYRQTCANLPAHPSKPGP